MNNEPWLALVSISMLNFVLTVRPVKHIRLSRRLALLFEQDSMSSNHWKPKHLVQQS